MGKKFHRFIFLILAATACFLASCATGASSVRPTAEKAATVETGENPWNSRNAVALGSVVAALPENASLTPGPVSGRWDIASEDGRLRGTLRVLETTPKPVPKEICSYAWRALQADYIIYEKDDYERMDGLRASSAVFLPKPGRLIYGILAIDAGKNVLIAEFHSAAEEAKALKDRFRTFLSGIRTSAEPRPSARVRGPLWFSAGETGWAWLSDYRDGFLVSNEATRANLLVGFTMAASGKEAPPGYFPEGEPRVLSVFFDNDIVKIGSVSFRDKDKNRCIIASMDAEENGIAFTLFVPSADNRPAQDIFESKDMRVLTSRLTGRNKAVSK